MTVFSKAQLVAIGYDRRDYLKQTAKRGEPGYVLGRSDMGMILENAKKWKLGFREDDGGSNSTRWGNLVDTRLLDNDRFGDLFAIQPERYTTTGMECPMCKSVTDSKKCAKCKVDRVEKSVEKEWSNQSATCQAWNEEQRAAGREVISAEDMQKSSEAKARIGEDANCLSFIVNSKHQVYCTAEYREKSTGVVVPVKILIDLQPADTHPDYRNDLGDLKTTRNGRPKEWNSDLFKHGYAMQAALYLDVFNAATGEERQSFCHVISENIHPYYCELRRLSMEFIELGRMQYRAALAKYAQCVKSGKWPGYHSQQVMFGIAQSEPAPWMASEAAAAAYGEIEEVTELRPASAHFDVIP